MRMKALMVIAALAVVAAMNVKAGYVVYKATYQPEVFNDTLNTTSGKGDKVKFDVYMIFETDANGLPDDATAPYRVVVIKPNKRLGEYPMVGENTTQAFEDFIAETGSTYVRKNPYDARKQGKNLSKIFIDPTALSSTKQQAVTDQYIGYSKSQVAAGWEGTGVTRTKLWTGYLPYAGPWSSVSIQQINEVLFVQDYGDLTGQRWGEYYSGSIKNFEVKSMKGVFSYYVNDATYNIEESAFSQRNQMKLDKKLTDAVSLATEMVGTWSDPGAVQEVTGYLAGKKYASTWAE